MNERVQKVGEVGRSPHGERGLKLQNNSTESVIVFASLSSWRAWIEMIPS